MGTNIYGVWQKKVDDAWVDIGDVDYGRDNTFFGWLHPAMGYNDSLVDGVVKPMSSIAEGRGLPEDFKLEMDACDCGYAPCDCFQRKGEFVGDKNHSWLLGSEILNAPTQVLLNIDTHCRWYQETWCKLLDDKNAAITHFSKEGTINLRMIHCPEDCTYDLRSRLMWFIQRVAHQMKYHGELRMVYGFG